MLLPVAWVNSCNRYVNGFMLLLNSTHMPNYCWSVAFIDVPRWTFGSVTGGRDCRPASAFDKEVSRFVTKSSLCHLDTIPKELNIDCPVGCSETQLDKGFLKAVTNMKKNVYFCSDLTAIHLLLVTAGVGAIVNTSIGTKALISPSTVTFKKALFFTEQVLRRSVRACEKIFTNT